MELQQQQPVPNYPPVTHRHFATQVSGIPWPLPHETEQQARNYAIEVSNRCQSTVDVYAPAYSGGAKLDTYRNGEPITAPGTPKRCIHPVG